MSALRYTSDGALAECPCCGSLDVGGAHDIVHCYSCGLAMKAPRPLKNAIDKWNRRAPVQPASERPTAAGSVGHISEYWMQGTKLIEECLAVAVKASHDDAPFPMDAEHAALWHRAQLEAFRHSLEMMGVPDADRRIAVSATPAQGLTDAKDAARYRWLTETKGMRFSPSGGRAIRDLADMNAHIDAAIERMTGNAGGEGARET